jgi:predicted metalloprotease with PDZ domain
MNQNVSPIRYTVRADQQRAHLFHVTLHVTKPETNQIVSLPAWIPGSYLVREFSKHLQGLQARQNSDALPLTQLDKCTWKIACVPEHLLVLTYEVYAFDNSVRTAWLDDQRGFFNGTSLCLRIHGQEGQQHALILTDVGLPKDWRAATALTPQKLTKRGFGTYVAANYDELVDSPVELGNFWQGEFTAAGVAHRFVVAGAPPSFDGARLLADTKTICEAEITFWHGQKNPHAPHQHYLFMLNAVHESYGGLEHRNSTALICKRADLPQLGQSLATEGYITLLGLISHEYFHTWNVKRLRPAEFANYDYAQENYTELLWFFEGFTSYYDDLLLHRVGLISSEHYLKLLTRTINAVLQTPGRLVQSVAQSSFDAWVKYYRQDENTANTTISYYTKGSLVALCLDLTLRRSGKSTLDDVMRALWTRCKAGPMAQSDVLAVLSELSGQSFGTLLQQWVHGTKDLPLKKLLESSGIQYEQACAQLTDQLGLKLKEDHGIQVRSVARGSAAEIAGFAAGDEWLGIQVAHGKSSDGWRLTKPEELPLYLGKAKQFNALVARDRKLFTLAVTLPKPMHQVKLTVQNRALVDAWLGTYAHSK